MNSYVEIDRLFGTPLNQVPKPKVPFKIKTWHILTAAGVLVAAAYGVYTFCNDVKSKFTRKDSDDSNKNNNAKFVAKTNITSDNKEEVMRERNENLFKSEKYSVKVK